MLPVFSGTNTLLSKRKSNVLVDNGIFPSVQSFIIEIESSANRSLCRTDWIAQFLQLHCWPLLLPESSGIEIFRRQPATSRRGHDNLPKLFFSSTAPPPTHLCQSAQAALEKLRFYSDLINYSLRPPFIYRILSLKLLLPRFPEKVNKHFRSCLAAIQPKSSATDYVAPFRRRIEIWGLQMYPSALSF